MKGAFKVLLEDGLNEWKARSRITSDKSTIASQTTNFVEISSALAALAIFEGLQSDNSDRHWEDATALLNEAEKKDALLDVLWLRKGLLLLVKGSYEAAEYQFQVVLSKNPNWIPAKIGAACVAFERANYRAALGTFQSVLKSLPNGPVELRAAIGACMERLGFVEDDNSPAEYAFKRVLELEEGKDANALASLGVINVNKSSEDPSFLAKGLAYLKEAYALDKKNPVALNHLGNHFFFKQDFAKAKALLENAASSVVKDPLVHAETRFFLAKLAHSQGDYEEAHRAYLEASTLNPEMTLAQFGLGQVLLQKKDFSGAKECFERVLAKNPTCPEASKILGLTLLYLGEDLKRAKELISAFEEGDVDVLIALGSAGLLSGSDLADSLTALTKAYDLDPAKFLASPVLINNLAILKHQSSAEEALDVLERAISMCQPFTELHDTLLFNKAVMLEGSREHKPDESRTIYQQIVKRRPGFLEAHLRLGMMAAASGNHNEAMEHYKDAIGQSEGCLEAWALLANLQFNKLKAITPARKSFERILNKIDRHDIYALVALGNFHCEIGRTERGQAERQASMKRSLEFFTKALQLEPTNAYAANGIAMVLAEEGKYGEAREILLQVKLAQPENTDAVINLAHCLVEMGHYGAAIHAYESVLDGLHGKPKVALLLYLSRALYLQGKAEKQAGALRQAIELLIQAEAYLSKDLPIKFNLAICRQELVVILSKAGHDQTTEAIQILAQAKSTFESLKDQQGFDPKIIAQRLKWCQSLEASLTSSSASGVEGHHGSASSQTPSRHAEHLAELRARRAKEQAEAEALEAAKKAAWEAEQQRIEATRKEMAAKLRATEEKIARTPQSAARSTEVDTAPEDDPIPTKRSSNKAPRSKRTRRAKISSDQPMDQDGQEDADEMAITRKTRTLALSKEYISTDDEDDDAGPADLSADE